MVGTWFPLVDTRIPRSRGRSVKSGGAGRGENHAEGVYSGRARGDRSGTVRHLSPAGGGGDRGVRRKVPGAWRRDRDTGGCAQAVACGAARVSESGTGYGVVQVRTVPGR